VSTGAVVTVVTVVVVVVVEALGSETDTCIALEVKGELRGGRGEGKWLATPVESTARGEGTSLFETATAGSPLLVAN
jgi:hypothetical protein